MPDFQALEWRKAATTDLVAQAIRKDVRSYRRERGRAGHRFSLNHVKSLWAANDGAHAVLNHLDDEAWQMWYRHPETGWAMVSWHLTRREAQAAAENGKSAPRNSELKEPDPGLYVLAGSNPDRMTIRTHCRSEIAATDIEAVYAKLGFATARETVAPPVG